MSGLFHIACFQGSPMISQVSELHSFQCLSNSPICLSIHLSMDTRLLLSFSYYEWCCDEHWCTSLCVSPLPVVPEVYLRSGADGWAFGSSPSAVQGATKLFPFYILISSVGGVLPCHTPLTPALFLALITATVAGVKWSPAVAVPNRCPASPHVLTCCLCVFRERSLPVLCFLIGFILIWVAEF